ncbi:unnamed protein product [Caenorhabditis auriculariae]|uniref:Ubiquitin-like domain-containing protein n=1 Tax=Caenorhabditis auriculariae TaxID=2777116 RepID=A0A8S1GQA2_9PELO|nr:unnamed protein product [Caenorhabditis auriculariae]
MSEEATPLVDSSHVELIIRSASQSTDDFTFSCPPNWSIRQLKEHVQLVATSHPPISTQRLIYAGAALNDSMIISDIMKQRRVVDGPQVFHLVCPPIENSQNIRQRNVNNLSNPVISSQPTNGAPPVNYQTWENWLSSQNQSQGQTANLQYQQYYASYYQQWANYHQQYYAAMTGMVPAPPQQITFNANLNEAAHAAPLQGNPQVQAIGNAQNFMPGNNIAVAERVDALEIFYRLFKFVLLFSAVLLYASFERFAIVLGLTLFLCFIQLRRHHARNNNQRQTPAAPAAGANDPAVQVNNNNAGESENAYDAPAPPAPSGVYVFVATCYSFITSFFASLVPDHPVPVDIN